MHTVVLRKGREKSVVRRHPWIFSGAIDSADTDIAPGETVLVRAADGTALGYGWHSPASQIRVRMLTSGPDAPDVAKLVANRIAAAVARRAEFLKRGYTNAVRLVNAESDGLPGVVADLYGDFAVCQLTCCGADRAKAAIASALMAAVPGCRGVSERIDNDSRARDGLPVGADGAVFNVLAGEEPPSEIKIFEGPCRFLVNVREGHKTGFYLDQRDARATVGALAKDADVLNCFSYTGGFGLFARANGAKTVTQVDISADALALARRNETLTDATGTVMRYEEADVFKFLRACRDAGRTYDLIVLDPPKFASTKGQLIRAARGYKDINLLAMKLLRPNGTLATFSCSGAMDAPFFDRILSEAAEDAGREFQIVARTRAGADHPVALAFPEGAYLKGVVLRAIS